MSDELAEIRQLAVRYAIHRDAHELDALISLFADDGVCDFGPDFGGRVIGHDALNAFFAASMEGNRSGTWETFHLVGTQLISLTGPASARGRSYCAGYARRDDETPLKNLLVYDDEYRKDDGTWRIAARRLYRLWPGAGDRPPVWPAN